MKGLECWLGLKNGLWLDGDPGKKDLPDAHTQGWVAESLGIANAGGGSSQCRHPKVGGAGPQEGRRNSKEGRGTE